MDLKSNMNESGQIMLAGVLVVLILLTQDTVAQNKHRPVIVSNIPVQTVTIDQNQPDINTSSIEISTSSQETFPVPPLYTGISWTSTSTKYSDAVYDTFGNTFPLSGMLYEASNTDPSAKSYTDYVNSLPANWDQPVGYYNGTPSLLDYYDTFLRANGYTSGTIFLDSKLNQTDDEKSAVASLSPAAADGPSGTVRGYIKYAEGKYRVVAISSNLSKNQVFISDVRTAVLVQ